MLDVTQEAPALPISPVMVSTATIEKVSWVYPFIVQQRPNITGIPIYMRSIEHIGELNFRGRPGFFMIIFFINLHEITVKNNCCEKKTAFYNTPVDCRCSIFPEYLCRPLYF
jgi:hypothetical protein